MASKLVRDRIPDIIRAEGKKPRVTIDRGTAPLFAKLREEVDELEAAGDDAHRVEELADVLQAFYAVVDRLGLGFDGVVQARLRRLGERGGFERGYILHDDGVASGEVSP